MNKSESVTKSLFKLAVPIIFVNILQTAYTLTDTFWVGRLGADAVAAVSVTFPVLFFLISLGGGFAVAGSTLVAQYYGAKNKKMINFVSAQTVSITLIVSLLLSFVGYQMSPVVLKILGIKGEVLGYAVDYLRISFLGLVFGFGYAMFQAIMRGIGEVKLPVFIALGGVLLNLVLDPLFIMGWGSIPANGVVGAAYATIGTQGLSTVIGMFVLFSGRYGIKPSHIKDFLLDWTFVKRVIKLGIPASIEQSVRALGLTFMVGLVASFGSLAVAAYGIGFRVLSFVIIPALGFAMASSVLVGHNIGAGNKQRAFDTAKLSAKWGFFVISIFGILSFIFANDLIKAFVPNDPEVIKMGAHFLRIMSLTFGLMGIQQSVIGAFRGAGSTFSAMVFALISFWVVQFPLAFVLSRFTSLGLEGIWWAFPISNIINSSLAYTWFLKGGWQNNKLTEEKELVEDVTEETLVEEGLLR